MNYKVNITKTGNPDMMAIVEHKIPSPAENEVLVRSLFSQDFNKAFELLEKGIVRPQIDEVIELKNTPKAHTKLEAGKVIGKLVLSIE